MMKNEWGLDMGKRTAKLAVTAGATVILGFVMTAPGAAQVSFPTVPKRTKNFDVSMVRAMDACTVPTLTVMSAGMPAAACPQTNVLTDDTLGMQKAKLRVTKSGKIRLLARGLTVGDAVRLRLILRDTQQNVTTNMGTGSVTFADVVVDCPQPPDSIAVKLNGSISTAFELGACLVPTSGLQLGNLEILEARLINVGNGRPFAAPGVMVQP